MSAAVNPILRGFNPDPSILRVGEDYYIATSTFEWFPGVQIHHSRDLVHWELIAHPLDRLSQLNMIGEDNSCGVWAPCLSYDDGTYYLIYTDVKASQGSFKDTHNYLVTAQDIRGPWSEPIYLNSSGFDPSLFHDEDGRKYLLNMQLDHRAYQTRFAGIVMQEYSVEKQCLVGPIKNIFRGTPSGITEGPHMYRHDGWYYLLTAEGGTGYEHAATMARSRQIDGPYEPDPIGHFLTSRHSEGYPLQKAGHASIVEGHNGRWYLAHLNSRPCPGTKRCILGRETSLQEVVWKDGWLRLAHGTNRPALQVEIPDEVGEAGNNDLFEDFDGESWSIHLQSQRLPLGERASLKERPGYLRLYGAESLNSRFHLSMLAHRQQEFHCRVTTKLDFNPRDYKEMAGLTYFYANNCYYYLFVSRDEGLGRVVSIVSSDLGKNFYPVGGGVTIPDEGQVWLRVETAGAAAQFYWSMDGENWNAIGEPVDATILSDDYFSGGGYGAFTGAFIGMTCQDLAGRKCCADFDFFDYKEL